jgi:hypothetical protein
MLISAISSVETILWARTSAMARLVRGLAGSIAPGKADRDAITRRGRRQAG